jgi:NADPH:quinone reductase-like Zn-dependent oxidoreductase
MGSFIVKENRTFLDELNQFVAAGQLHLHVRRTYPLVEAADAIRALDAPHQAGRIVITI